MRNFYLFDLIINHYHQSLLIESVLMKAYQASISVYHVTFGRSINSILFWAEDKNSGEQKKTKTNFFFLGGEFKNQIRLSKYK